MPKKGNQKAWVKHPPNVRGMLDEIKKTVDQYWSQQIVYEELCQRINYWYNYEGRKKDFDLKSNIVVRSGFEFNEKLPLGFFEFDDDTDRSVLKSKELHVNSEFGGKLVIKEYGFEPAFDGVKPYSPEVFVVSRAKVRKVLTLQNTEFTKEFTDNIFIIPIQSLRQPVPDNYSNVKDYNKALLEYNKVNSSS
ncbi:MAG: hypothetical protein KAX49_16870 [Halanaerobiales bacterium]|nr:hypothetical protein [Halanaerobiales bacterium]